MLVHKEKEKSWAPEVTVNSAVHLAGFTASGAGVGGAGGGNRGGAGGGGCGDWQSSHNHTSQSLRFKLFRI